jgi:Exonuclease
VKEHTDAQAQLAGNSIHVDFLFLKKYMPRLAEHLHYRLVDVSTVGELARRWFPHAYRKAPKKKVVPPFFPFGVPELLPKCVHASTPLDLPGILPDCLSAVFQRFAFKRPANILRKVCQHVRPAPKLVALKSQRLQLDYFTSLSRVNHGPKQYVL